MQEQGRCNFIPGKILTRQCPNKATCRCLKCNRDMCNEHAMPTSAGIMCVECTAGKPLTPFHEEDIYTDEEMALFDRNHALWAGDAGSLYDSLGLKDDQFDAS